MLNTPKPDQKDIQTSITTLQAACSVLSHSLRETGQAVPQPPIRTSDSLADFNALENYHAQLAGTLARNPVYAAQPGAKSAARAEQPATAPAQSPALDVAPGAPLATAELTRDEIKALTWTERVQIAGGHLTLDQARERIAARKAKADGKSAPANLTAKLVQAQGATSLTELRQRKASDHDFRSE